MSFVNCIWCDAESISTSVWPLDVDHSTRLDILERACTKMMTSGHRENFIRQAVVKGIGAFREKLERSQLDTDNPGFQPLYQKDGWRNNER